MSDTQTAFAKALFDPAEPVPAGLVRPDGAPAGKRFDVYRNNVISSLIEALAAAYPVVEALVGDAFFHAVAGVYVRQHPARSPLMILYGEEFPAFLDTFEPTQTIPYLADTARLELARRKAFHAADEQVADPALLAELDAAALLNIRFTLHDAAQVLPSQHPILSIWRYNATDDQSPITATSEDVLVARPGEVVTMQALPPGGATFLQSIADGHTLGAANDMATTADPEFDLAANLGGMFTSGIISTIRID